MMCLTEPIKVLYIIISFSLEFGKTVETLVLQRKITKIGNILILVILFFIVLLSKSF